MYEDEKWQGCGLIGKLIGLRMRTVEGSYGRICSNVGRVCLEGGVLLEQAGICRAWIYEGVWRVTVSLAFRLSLLLSLPLAGLPDVQ